jgi:hypothetical protein
LTLSHTHYLAPLVLLLRLLLFPCSCRRRCLHCCPSPLLMGGQGARHPSSDPSSQASPARHRGSSITACWACRSGSRVGQSVVNASQMVKGPAPVPAAASAQQAKNMMVGFLLHSSSSATAAEAGNRRQEAATAAAARACAWNGSIDRSKARASARSPHVIKRMLPINCSSVRQRPRVQG